MAELDLPPPAMMAYAVPGNERCGRWATALPEDLQRRGQAHDQG